jgi:hypothetical protein
MLCMIQKETSRSYVKEMRRSWYPWHCSVCEDGRHLSPLHASRAHHLVFHHTHHGTHRIDAALHAWTAFGRSAYSATPGAAFGGRSGLLFIVCVMTTVLMATCRFQSTLLCPTWSTEEQNHKPSKHGRTERTRAEDVALTAISLRISWLHLQSCTRAHIGELHCCEKTRSAWNKSLGPPMMLPTTKPTWERCQGSSSLNSHLLPTDCDRR